MDLRGAFEAEVLSIDWAKRQAEIRLVAFPSVKYRARMVRDIWTKDQRSKPTTLAAVGDHNHSANIANDGGHAHSPNPHDHRLADDLAVGDHVIVLFLHGRSDSPVITNRL